MKKSTS